MLTLGKVRTRGVAVRKSRYCVVLDMKKKTEEDVLFVLAHVVCSKPEGSGRKHKVELKIYDLGLPWSKRRFWCYCDCDDFKYRCEYVLAKKGSSKLRKCLPEPPRETNPRMRPWICKHILVVLEKLVMRY